MCFIVRSSALARGLKKFQETYAKTDIVCGWKVLQKDPSGKLTSIYHSMRWKRGEYVSAYPSKIIPSFTVLPNDDLLIEVRGGLHIFREKDRALIEKECISNLHSDKNFVVTEVCFEAGDLIAVNEETFVASSAKVTWVVGEVPV